MAFPGMGTELSDYSFSESDFEKAQRFARETKAMSQIDQPGNPRFLALLDEMRALHLRKAADYGTNADPLANIRAATEFGDNPAKAVAVRLGDKISRLKAWSRSGKLANEGLRDTFMDVACYGLIGLVMAEEFGDDPKCTIPKPVTDAAATGVKPR